eukprot:194826-Chlamydomonas_euryale.AAC.1
MRKHAPPALHPRHMRKHAPAHLHVVVVHQDDALAKARVPALLRHNIHSRQNRHLGCLALQHRHHAQAMLGVERLSTRAWTGRQADGASGGQAGD